MLLETARYFHLGSTTPSVSGKLIVPSATFPGISISELHQWSLPTLTSRWTFTPGFTSTHEITQEDIVCISHKLYWRFIFMCTIRLIAVNARHWYECTDRVTSTPCTRAIICSKWLHHPNYLFAHQERHHSFNNRNTIPTHELLPQTLQLQSSINLKW